MFPAVFRDKLQQVQQELTSSIRTLVLAEPSSPSAVTSKNGKNFEGIHLDAGADLLNYYQFHWCRIREASEHNFRLADATDKTISAISSHVQQQHSCISTLSKNLSFVPQMTNQLQKIIKSMATTEKLIRETESQLLVLEDVLKEEDFEKRVKEYECNASLLREEKLASLENLQTQLAMEHLVKVKELETEQRNKALERQAIFEEAFHSEIQYYKESGTIPKLDLPRAQTSTLEEYVFEDDSSLARFLEE